MLNFPKMVVNLLLYGVQTITRYSLFSRLQDQGSRVQYQTADRLLGDASLAKMSIREFTSVYLAVQLGTSLSVDLASRLQKREHERFE